ncbi:kynureninase [Roseateles depolymerans]|uniref:Kynureninase n=1 Tax=Roseateles depolymerans TaxID=76731 RepID=A0A0U3E4H7_9BURK|nr:kynureninase [Roseateles depolymerans]ALV08133.1 kynureninase [Roseateles depolymerans]REG21645.1 kynureninase [Roseateles depolymerans]
MTTRQDCQALDAADPLAPLRQQMLLPPGVIYLDGNSLGAMPAATPARVQQVVTQEWGQDLIKSWNTAGWIDLPTRIGDKIARLIGAGPGEVVVADSTSLNIYKVLTAAVRMIQAESPGRTTIVTERSNFPTDLYISQSVAEQHGMRLVLVDSAEELAAQLNDDLAVLLITDVNYRTGAWHDMAALTRAAHEAGALTIWDLCHSAGAVPVDLTGADADFAIGCGYKYLNGGPGAPAFVWVHPRHADRFWQPLSGWLGHAAPFEFSPDYRPAPGIRRYICGTPAIISMAALECGVDTLLAAEPMGGMAALRRKSLALTELFARLAEERCGHLGVTVVSPREDARRGSQVCLALKPPLERASYAVVQALIERGVIGDYRAGDPDRLDQVPHILRFGFTPLYVGFTDAWDAVEHLYQVLTREEWREARFNQKAAVT